MSTIKTKDGSQLYYKELGQDQPIVSSHGWPLIDAIHIGHSTGGGEVAPYIGRHKAAYGCIRAFSETDFTEDLKKFDMPTVLKVYAGAAHGMCSTLKDRVNADLLSFIEQGRVDEGDWT